MADGLQQVTAVSGAAYGVIGADLHIFGDGSPVYLLKRWTTEAGETPLDEWRRAGTRLAAQWVHGPDGEQRARLAARFAGASAADGWLVVRAVHGPAEPAAERLDPAGHAGVLLVVEDADEWPPAHLAWLFSNALLHRAEMPARLLLLGQCADGWPAIRATLANHHADHASLAL